MAEPAITQDEQSLKQRAMRRLAIALALIAAAIVALALLDRYNASLKKSEPVSVPPREAPTSPAPPPSVATTPPPPSSAEQAQRPPPPPPPVVSNQELPAPPAPARPAAPESPAKKAPAAPSTEKSAPSAEQKPAATTAQKPTVPSRAPAGPAQPKIEAAPTSRGFIVQVGVFMSGNNARALQKKLADKGIPTYTETRVLVGPFNDRAEAEAVVRQIKEMGLEGVVVAPPAQ